MMTFSNLLLFLIFHQILPKSPTGTRRQETNRERSKDIVLKCAACKMANVQIEELAACSLLLLELTSRSSIITHVKSVVLVVLVVLYFVSSEEREEVATAKPVWGQAASGRKNRVDFQ